MNYWSLITEIRQKFPSIFIHLADYNIYFYLSNQDWLHPICYHIDNTQDSTGIWWKIYDSIKELLWSWQLALNGCYVITETDRTIRWTKSRFCEMSKSGRTEFPFQLIFAKLRFRTRCSLKVLLLSPTRHLWRSVSGYILPSLCFVLSIDGWFHEINFDWASWLRWCVSPGLIQRWFQLSALPMVLKNAT